MIGDMGDEITCPRCKECGWFTLFKTLHGISARCQNCGYELTIGSDQERAEGKARAGHKEPAPPRPLTSNTVRDVLSGAGFPSYGSNYGGGGAGWTVSLWQGGPDVAVDLMGVDLSPFGPRQGPGALLDEYAKALEAAGFDTRIPVSTVLVSARRAK
jgi:hypothetical protein